jgi:para-aminobenzoate synthetase component 1
MSNTVSLEEIPYSPDSCEVFESLRDLPGAAMLDSSFPHTLSGRFDILCAQPVPTPTPPAPDASPHCWLEHFAELARFHRDHYGVSTPASPDIPFCGGLLGVLGYEAGNPVNRVNSALTPTRHSGASLHAYDWAVLQDHLRQRAVLVAQPGVAAGQRRDLLARLRDRRSTQLAGFRLGAPFSSNLNEMTYRRAFERIQGYIHAGDCYQVNLAQRFTAPYEGDPWRAYCELRQTAAAPFSAFLALDDGEAVICLSPERFLSLHGHHVQTAPIKGTRPRHRDPAADQLAAAELYRSAKDRAENLMIVDLLRNDLGRSCTPGSIHVDSLFEVQSFPTVHHLVSTISGELTAGRTAYDLLRDSFPGGSITGAPKRRAMEIIAELEPHPREVYCGSVLYVSADGRMDSNIAIRTLLCSDSQVHCWGGGGIVADSQWRQEYQETYDKVGKFLSLLEQLQ